MKYRIAIFVSILVLFAGSVSASSIGTAPGTQDIGELSPGETYEVHFYVTTRGIDNPFTLNPEYRRASASNFERESTENGFNPHEASQQDKSDWIDFSQNSYTVDPNDRQVASLADGGSVVYNQQISYTIDVPENAEPGYHIGSVDLKPELDRDAASSAVMNLGLTRYNFYFKLPGTAERDLRIMDVRAVRSDSDQARFDFIVENNGTVTTWVQRSTTQLYDQEGRESGELTTGGQYLEPGEQSIISTYWNSANIEAGEYRVGGEVNYMTGHSFVDETVDISDTIQVEDTDEETDTNVPYWLVIMILVVAGALMYSFEMDPIIIAAILGVAGISAFIIISGLPTYLVGVLIAITAGLLIYGAM